MCGLTQNELHLLMSGSRQAGMKPPLWATLTPSSETWTVQDLLKELVAEHQAMQSVLILPLDIVADASTPSLVL